MIAKIKIESFLIASKVKVLSILGLTYYFVVATTLFSPDLISNISNSILFDLNFFKVLLLCFFMAFMWYFSNYFSNYFIFKKINNQDQDFDLNILKQSILFITLAFVINLILGYNFLIFLIIAYSIFLIRTLWIFINLVSK